MPLETATFIDGLDVTNPLDGDLANELDDHLRLIKSTLRNTFLGDGGGDVFDKSILSTLAEMNTWNARIAALESQGAPIGAIPKLGQVTITTDEIISIGFTPRVIMAWGFSKPLAGERLSYDLSTGYWSQAGYKALGMFRSQSGAKFYDNSIFAVGGTIDAITVTAVNPDGFTFTRAPTTTDEVEIMYLAIP